MDLGADGCHGWQGRSLDLDTFLHSAGCIPHIARCHGWRGRSLTGHLSPCMGCIPHFARCHGWRGRRLDLDSFLFLHSSHRWDSSLIASVPQTSSPPALQELRLSHWNVLFQEPMSGKEEAPPHGKAGNFNGGRSGLAPGSSCEPWLWLTGQAW